MRSRSKTEQSPLETLYSRARAAQEEVDAQMPRFQHLVEMILYVVDMPIQLACGETPGWGEGEGGCGI